MDDIKIIDGSLSIQLSKHVNEQIDDHPLWASRFLISDPDAIYQVRCPVLFSLACFKISTFESVYMFINDKNCRYIWIICEPEQT